METKTEGATTFSITTICIMTLTINGILSATFYTVILSGLCSYAEHREVDCSYAGCIMTLSVMVLSIILLCVVRMSVVVLTVPMLNGIMQNAGMLIVIMLNISRLNAIVLSVVMLCLYAQY
jgi:hypothetical protein